MPDTLHPIRYNDVYYCTVKNEWQYNYVTGMYGRTNVEFGELHHTDRNTESEFIFSRSVARFQHLIVL